MSYEDHPVDTLLRALAVDPGPTYADVLTGRRALEAAIAAGVAAPGRALPHRRWLPSNWLRHASAGAVAAAVLIAVVVGAGVLRPEPVTALGELAQVAERAEAVSAGRGEYTYTRASEIAPRFVDRADLGLEGTGQVVYLVPTERERWLASDGVIIEATTYGDPAFFDAAAEAAYEAVGMAERDQIGQTVVSEYRSTDSILDQRAWPSDPGALLVALRSQVSSEGNPIAETAAIVELAAELLSETNAAPGLRAAVIEVLDELGLEVVERSNGAAVVVGVEYVDTVPVRRELVFDGDANLVAERVVLIDGDSSVGIPAGAVLEQSTFEPVRTVDSVDLP